MSTPAIVIDVALCSAFALSCAAVEAQTGSTIGVASSKRANAVASTAAKRASRADVEQRPASQSAAWRSAPYDDSKLADRGAPAIPPE